MSVVDVFGMSCVVGILKSIGIEQFKDAESPGISRVVQNMYNIRVIMWFKFTNSSAFT